MLKKCLKYDFRAIFPVWWILAVSILLISPIGGISIRYLISKTAVNEDAVSIFPVILSFLGTFITVISFVAFGLINCILVCYRYYQNFFTDSGYLTFTLPVRRSKLFFSKILSGLIWNFATILVMLVGGAIICLIIPGLDGNGNFFDLSTFNAATFFGTLLKFTGFIFTCLWESVGAMTILYTLQAVVIFVGLEAVSLLFLYFCITLGCMIAKKNKVLISIGIYYGLNWLFSIVSSVFITFGNSFVIAMSTTFERLFESTAFASGFFALLMFLIITVIALISAVLWLISLGSIERRLNLQ